MLLYVHRNRRLIRDWEPRTSTSTSTPLLSSDSSMLLYVHRNRRLIRDGEPRTATSTFTLLLSSVNSRLLLSCCFTSTEAGRGRESEGLTAETVRKRPERPWTAARTMEVLRRCPLAIAQRLVHCAIAVSTAVLDRVTKTMSVALLLTNNLDNSTQKTSNLLSLAPPPYS